MHTAPAVARVLALQRSAGNHAVGRMLQRQVVPKGEAEEQRFAELMGRWKKLKKPPMPWTQAVKTADTLDELERWLIKQESSETAPQQKAKKKKKEKPMSFDAFKAEQEKRKAWGPPGSQTGVQVVTTVTQIEAPAYRPPPTLDELLVETEAAVPGTNAPIIKLIRGGKKRKPAKFAARMFPHDEIQEETVYLPMRIYVRDDEVDGAFLVYLHYHPNPTTGNWLHVKRTKQSTPEHRVDLSWWFVRRDLLEDAHGAWQDKHDPRRATRPPWPT